MKEQLIRDWILAGNTALGIEFGSTRIKSVLIGPDFLPLASGSHTWENQLTDGIWTYSLDAVWTGLQESYAELVMNIQTQYGVHLTKVGCIGVSAMMHGYLPFDGEGKLLVPFRTWRNTITEQAAKELTELFQHNIPQRWSIAHLDQAILNGEAHVPEIRYLTTLEGYVHWQLTGQKVIGVGEASGMFPVDGTLGIYDPEMMRKYEDRIATWQLPWRLAEILPKILQAGDDAGELTELGAHLLDPSGALEAGIPFCPPEGDAETGMTATNSIAPRTGNVSAGTSIFSMVVLERPLKKIYPEIDLVMTPTGLPVAMVHCNNCTTDLNEWAEMLKQFALACGVELNTNQLYTTIFRAALQGEADGGGLMSYNYDAGEPVTGLTEGRPLFVREPGRKLSFSNFSRTLLMSALATLKIGNDLLRSEGVRIDTIYGHGGYFKTPVVGQKLLAAALKTPVTVMETAGEGGAWGMALLAGYRVWRLPKEGLDSFLADRVFAPMERSTLSPEAEDEAGFDVFTVRYRAGLAAEQAAVDAF